MCFAYVGFIGDHFFLLSTDSTCSRVPGDKGGLNFFRFKIFFALIYIQIGVLQFVSPVRFYAKSSDFYAKLFSNCIRSICTKPNTNLLHTNSIHSILHKIGQVIQIVVHQFVHKTSAEKKS